MDEEVLGLEGTISEFARQFANSTLNHVRRGIAEDIPFDIAIEMAYNLLMSEPRHGRVQLQLSDWNYKVVLRTLTGVEQVYNTVNHVSRTRLEIDKARQNIANLKHEDIDFAGRIEALRDTEMRLSQIETELIKGIDETFTNGANLGVYQLLQSIKTSPTQLLRRLKYAEHVEPVQQTENITGKHEIFKFSISSKELGDLLKFLSLYYSAWFTRRDEAQNDIGLYWLKGLIAGLGTVHLVAQNPSLYERIKSLVDPELDVKLGDDPLKNLQELFLARLRHGDVVSIGYSIPYSQLDNLLKTLGTTDGITIAHLHFNYKGQNFGVRVQKSSKGSTDDDISARIDLDKPNTPLLQEFAGRLRDYIDSHLKRITSDYRGNWEIKIGKLPDNGYNGNRVLKVIKLLFEPEVASRGMFYEQVQNPKSDLGLTEDLSIVLDHIPLEKILELAIPPERVWNIHTRYQPKPNFHLKKITLLEAQAREAYEKQREADNAPRGTIYREVDTALYAAIMSSKKP